MRLVVSELSTAQLYPYLVSAIAPRPICFASTVDKGGIPNLSPFSFFNVFSGNPPILIFSPLRRMRDNTIKHTLENIYDVKEVVINVVNYDMVHQASLSSCEFPKGTNEFIKAGFTQVPSDFVKPFRVQESPVQFECKVDKIIETGNGKGAGNLIICEVVCVHINDEILDEDGIINPNKIDLVARLGGDFYCRASGSALFKVPKPNHEVGIGIDGLPENIRNSKVLTGKHLGILGNCKGIPPSSVDFYDDRLFSIVSNKNEKDREQIIHQYAADLIDKGEVDKAWQILLNNLFVV